MNKSLLALLALLAGCIAPTPIAESEITPPTPTATPAARHEFNRCVVTGYDSVQFSPDYIEDSAIAIDSFGHEHRLNISDAIIGDEFTIRYGEVIEQTYEGWSEENDYYIVELEYGDLYEVESDDLNVGDQVTVYFIEDTEIAIRTMYGWR